ncbi:MAG: hypothetical protein R2744_09490 [Bacteroidales bacterium]
MLKNYKPRTYRSTREYTTLSGLEALVMTPEKNFINVGERTNVAGSKKFCRADKGGAV